MKKANVILISILFIIIIVASIVLTLKIINDKNEIEKKQEAKQELMEKDAIIVELDEKTEKNINIFKGNDRPFAVMIDNHKGAQPQGGLNDAYLVYEIIVEGGESRMMALFKGANVEKIGPIRSSRHYFLDYALENDAIYVHYGWSPRAQADIPNSGVNNINGLVESERLFWRTKDKSAPHNVATKTENLISLAEKKGYRTTSNAESVLNYVTEEVDLTNGQSAKNIVIPYSPSNSTEYKYNEETKMYNRYSKGKKQADWGTGEEITTKNIILTFAKNYAMEDIEKKDRQDLKNIGKLNGYYITNGKAIPITCTKNARNQKTIYEDMQGKQIEVNDGKTFINICPIDAEVTIE